MSGAGEQDRARADEPPGKERVKVKSQHREGADGLTAKGRVQTSWSAQGAVVAKGSAQK